MSLLLDPEGTLPPESAAQLLARLKSSSPSLLLSLLFLEERSARHVHGVVDRVAAASSTASVDQLLARVAPAAQAVALNLHYERLHPFRGGLFRSGAALQLSQEPLERSAVSAAATLLVSWQERRMRVEFAPGASDTLTTILLRGKFRSQLRYSSTKLPPQNLGTPLEERAEILQRLESVLQKVEHVHNVRRWIFRGILLVVLGVVGFVVGRYLLRLRRCRAVIAERQADAVAVAAGDEQQHPQPQQATTATTCSICLVDFGNSDEPSLYLSCHHRFHRQCLVPWLTSSAHQSSCPLCRRSDQELAVALQQDAALSSSTPGALVWAVLANLWSSVTGTSEARAILLNGLFHFSPVLMRMVSRLVLGTQFWVPSFLRETPTVLELRF